MFTLTDICNIAIQIERNGESTYRRAGEETSHPGLSSMLAWMADEERRHAEWFEALAMDIEIDTDHEDVEQMGRELLRQMMDSQTFSLHADHLKKAGNVDAMLTQSLRFEKDTILFYEMLGAFIDDPEIMGQLERIIEEEKRHVAQIERMQKNWQSEPTI